MKKVLINDTKRKKGFTLLELIISVGILSIIVVPFSNLVMSSFKITNSAKLKQEATNLTQMYMEKIKADETIDFDKIITHEKEFSDYGYPALENGFNITYAVDEREEIDDDSVIKESIDDIVFDYTVEISDEEEYINIYDKDENRIYRQNKVSDFNYRVTNITSDIIFDIDELEETETKTKPKDEDIYVRIDIKRDLPGNTLIINAKNECPGQLIFYFVKSSNVEEDVEYKVFNEGGNITKYVNINSGTGNAQKSRLYKVIIKVEKDGQVVENEAYKAF